MFVPLLILIKNLALRWNKIDSLYIISFQYFRLLISLREVLYPEFSYTTAHWGCFLVWLFTISATVSRYRYRFLLKISAFSFPLVENSFSSEKLIDRENDWAFIDFWMKISLKFQQTFTKINSCTNYLQVFIFCGILSRVAGWSNSRFFFEISVINIIKSAFFLMSFYCSYFQ